MINRKKYSFNNYSKRYRKFFIKERIKIRKLLPKAKIEHIGSTAVPYLGGKGIVDIVISVPKVEIVKAINKLKKNNYEYKPFSGDNDRRFFQKTIRYSGKERRIHIHLTPYNSHTWQSLILVRDYLIRHPGRLKEYSRIKREAIRYAKGEGKKYREYKNKFLKDIEKTALKESRP